MHELSQKSLQNLRNEQAVYLMYKRLCETQRVDNGFSAVVKYSMTICYLVYPPLLVFSPTK